MPPADGTGRASNGTGHASNGTGRPSNGAGRPSNGAGRPIDGAAGEPLDIRKETAALFEELLTDGITVRVRVTGMSMAPFLRGGEVATIKKTPAGSLQVGDLIFFKKDGDTPILHRLLRIERPPDGPPVFHTKGDALVEFDPPVMSTDVMGKVTAVLRSPEGDVINMTTARQRALNRLTAIYNIMQSKLYTAFFRLSGKR